jgi:hypothetical protein
MQDLMDLNDNSKGNTAKYIIAFLAASVLLYACIRGSWWSFTQTLEFLKPAFDTLSEAVVFAIIVQYGPQPALFFIGVYRNKLRKSQRDREVWIARNRDDERNIIPLQITNDIFQNGMYLIISTFFFFGLSTLDFLTNVGQVNNTADLRITQGRAMGHALYSVMMVFAFVVLWAEELAGELFLFLFIMLERLSITFGFSNSVSFIKAQDFFKKASGHSDSRRIGRRSVNTYQRQNVQGSDTQMRTYSPIDSLPKRKSYIPPMTLSEYSKQDLPIPTITEDNEEL